MNAAVSISARALPLLFLHFFAAAVQQSAHAQEGTLSAIRDAWQRRESRTPMVGLEWAVVEDRLNVFSRFENTLTGATSQSVSRMTIGESAFRYEGVTHHHGAFDALTRASGQPTAMPDVASFTHACDKKFAEDMSGSDEWRLILSADGTRALTLWLPKKTGDFPRGIVSSLPDESPGARAMLHSRSPAAPAMHTLLCAPPLLVYRPLASPWLNVRLDRSKVIRHDAILNGCRCVLLEEACDAKNVRRFWLDPARQFLPLRIVGGEIADDAGNVQLDIEYAARGEDWSPTRWTVMSLGRRDGQPVNAFVSVEVQNLRFEAGPEPKPIKDQSVRGTWVVESPARRQYLVGDSADAPVAPQDNAWRQRAIKMFQGSAEAPRLPVAAVQPEFVPSVAPPAVPPMTPVAPPTSTTAGQWDIDRELVVMSVILGIILLALANSPQRRSAQRSARARR